MNGKCHSWCGGGVSYYIQKRPHKFSSIQANGGVWAKALNGNFHSFNLFSTLMASQGSERSERAGSCLTQTVTLETLQGKSSTSPGAGSDFDQSNIV